jgi:hypothetical protein
MGSGDRLAYRPLYNPSPPARLSQAPGLLVASQRALKLGADQKEVADDLLCHRLICQESSEPVERQQVSTKVLSKLHPRKKSSALDPSS